MKYLMVQNIEQSNFYASRLFIKQREIDLQIETPNIWAKGFPEGRNYLSIKNCDPNCAHLKMVNNDVK